MDILYHYHLSLLSSNKLKLTMPSLDSFTWGLCCFMYSKDLLCIVKWEAESIADSQAEVEERRDLRFCKAWLVFFRQFPGTGREGPEVFILFECFDSVVYRNA